MTNYFDDDSFWDDQASESTSEITRVNRRTPERTRSHHVVKREATPPPMRHDDAEDDLWLEPVTRSTVRPGPFGNIDPRLLSAGAVALVAMLAVPIVGAFGGGDGDDEAFRSIAEAQTTTTATPTTIPIEIVITAAVDPIESDPAESDSLNASSDDGSSSDSADSASSGESASSNDSAPAAPAALSAPADCSNPYDVASGDFWVSIATAADVSLEELLAANNASAETAIFPGSDVCLPDGAVIGGASAYAGSGDGAVAVADEPESCSNVYEPVPGDYWLRIADVSGVSIEDLLAENNATTETPIFPGADICLPAGATTPTAATEPPTTPAPTTAAPTTAAPTTPAPTTAAPTPAPTTTAPRNTTSPPSGGTVEQMIRDVWPDELEDEALRIAWRESNYRADVTSPTGCCVGVFQMHWEAHRSWLADMGVTSRDQLFDARTNIEAAYALYQRSGGWGPWAL